MKCIIRFQSFSLTVLAVTLGVMLISILCSCASKPEEAPDVWALLEQGDEKAKNFFIGEIDVHATSPDGKTPLHYAAEHDDAALATFFLMQGAEVDAEDSAGQTPLGICAQKGNVNAAKALVAFKANIHKPSQIKTEPEEAGEPETETAEAEIVPAAEVVPEPTEIIPAQLAITNMTFLQAILTPESIESTNDDGKTILHLAGEEGNVPAVTAILAVMNDTNTRSPLTKKDSSGNNPLDIALARPDSRNHMEAAEKLILAEASSANAIYPYFAPAVMSANYNTRRPDGIAPLHFAAGEGYEGLISFLIEKKANVNIQNASGASPLHEAVRAGKVNAITLLLKNGANVNAQDAKGNSVLHVAAPPQEHTAIIKILLANTINPNLRDDYGDTPLHVLVSLNRGTEVVQALFAGDVDASARNIAGKTALFLAVQENRTALIPLLLSRGSDIFAADNSGITPFDVALRMKGPVLDALITPETVHQKDSAGNTILHITVHSKGNAVIIGKIIEQKGNVNARNRAGDTPLHMAARTNQKETGEYLLSNGANIFFTNSAAESPLYIALTHRSGVLQWMFTPETAAAHDGLGNTMLHYAALWGMDKHIHFIIEKGVSTESANATGETPLFWAVKYDSASTVKKLLDERANRDARDSLGNSVLHAAVRWNARKAVTVLLDARIDPNVHSLSLTTPLHEAVRLGVIDIAVTLLNRGADIEVRDAGGNTPFMDAVQAGNLDAVKLLVSKGANPMTRNSSGDTPLHFAVAMEDNAIIKTLLDKGVSIHARNTRNRTPFQIALTKDSNIVSALLTRDRIFGADDFGNSPLHIALQEQVPSMTLNAIIGKGVPLSAVDSNGRIPLRLAVDMNAWEAVKTLADAGSNPFSVAVDNKSSGEIAVSRGTDAIRAMFSGMAITAKDASGNTILHYAARMGKAPAISLLLELGASKDIRNISAESPADIAARWNNAENIALLN